MGIRTLCYFVEVIRQQNFIRAAEKLLVTQFTTNKMLKSLEDRLNCALLIHDGRRLLSANTGRVVFERGQVILGEFSQLESELSDTNHLYKGVLRLGTLSMVGMLMAEPTSRFRERYPGVEPKIVEFGGLAVQQAVNNGEFDMAMIALPIEEDSHFATLPPFNHLLCVLTPGTAPWKSTTSLSPAKLAAYPLVIYNEESALSQQSMRLLTEHDVKPRIAVHSGQWDFLAVMVQAGIGVAILPEPIRQRLNPQNFYWTPSQSELHWELGMVWQGGVYMSYNAEARLTCSRAFWLEQSPGDDVFHRGMDNPGQALASLPGFPSVTLTLIGATHLLQSRQQPE